MQCAADNKIYRAEGDPTVKLRLFPSTQVYQSYSSPQITYTKADACDKVKACPVGEPMPLKGEPVVVAWVDDRILPWLPRAQTLSFS